MSCFGVTVELCTGLSPGIGDNARALRVQAALLSILIVLYAVACIFGAAAGRASMIAFFLFTDLTGLAWQAWNHLLDMASLWRALDFLPALIVGVWVGNRAFNKADPVSFRRWVLRLLMLLSMLTGARALVQIL